MDPGLAFKKVSSHQIRIKGIKIYLGTESFRPKANNYPKMLRFPSSALAAKLKPNIGATGRNVQLGASGRAPGSAASPNE